MVPARRYAGISSRFEVFKTYNITGLVHGALIRIPSIESCCGSCVIKYLCLKIRDLGWSYWLIPAHRDFRLAGTIKKYPNRLQPIVGSRNATMSATVDNRTGPDYLNCL